jgi:hypothetical protein
MVDTTYKAKHVLHNDVIQKHGKCWNGAMLNCCNSLLLDASRDRLLSPGLTPRVLAGEPAMLLPLQHFLSILACCLLAAAGTKALG